MVQIQTSRRHTNRPARRTPHDAVTTPLRVTSIRYVKEEVGEVPQLDGPLGGAEADEDEDDEDEDDDE